MDGSEKDLISRPHCVSTVKVKLREGKDKSGSNKIKKLRQRISASFGRLTISKEETIPENDFEFESGSFQCRSLGGDRMAHSFSSSPSPLVCQSLNGTPDRKSKGANNHRGHPKLLQCLGHSLDESSGKKERGYQAEVGAHGDGPRSARIYSPGLGITPVPPHPSIFSCLPNSQKSHHHSSLKRAFSLLTSSSSATSVGNQQQHSHHHFSFFQKGGSKQNSEEDAAASAAACGAGSSGSKTRLKTGNKPTPENLEKLQSKFHLHRHHKLQHTSVQRHHSTGDMLVATVSPERGSSGDVPKNFVHAARPCVDQSNGTSEAGVTRNGVKLRHHRPRSEGSFSGDGMRNKRASSFGSNSPFGKVCAYEKLEQLGEGSYATVYKGISLLTNKVVALKEIRLQPEEGTPFTAIREASLLKGLKHANIVTLHDIVHTKESLTFVFEFVHTDLGQYLEKHPGGINPKNVKIFMFQLLRGLLFCHNRQILHRDLKPQNLLISEIGELKLADFGLARAKSVPSRTYSNEVVTLWYRPPDVLLGSTDYSTSLDIWGVGCIFTEMITGTATFPGMKDSYDQLTHIWQVFGTPNECTWEGVTNFPNYNLEKFGSHPPRKLIKSVPKLSSIPYAEHLAESLLQLQPNKRIDAYNALHHKYFYDIPNKLYNLPDVVSIFDLPCIRLAPELNDLLGTRSNHSAPSVSLVTSSTSYISSANQKSGLQQLDKYPIPNPPGGSILKSSQPSENSKPEAILPPANNTNVFCKTSTAHVFGPSLSFKGPSAV